jgi:hypothetical protein
MAFSPCQCGLCIPGEHSFNTLDFLSAVQQDWSHKVTRVLLYGKDSLYMALWHKGERPWQVNSWFSRKGWNSWEDGTELGCVESSCRSERIWLLREANVLNGGERWRETRREEKVKWSMLSVTFWCSRKSIPPWGYSDFIWLQSIFGEEGVN